MPIGNIGILFVLFQNGSGYPSFQIAVHDDWLIFKALDYHNKLPGIIGIHTEFVIKGELDLNVACSN